MKERRREKINPFWRKNKEQKDTQITYREILKRTKYLSERNIIQLLLKGDSHENSPLMKATPDGYRYRQITKNPLRRKKKKQALYIGAHYADSEDFIGGTTLLLSTSLHNFILTDGVKGANQYTPEQTKRIRLKEAERSASLLKTQFSVSGLPDYELLSHMKETTLAIKEKIKKLHPPFIITHAPEADHPDHNAVLLGTLTALYELSQEGHFKIHQRPALYITDPEFGRKGLSSKETGFPYEGIAQGQRIDELGELIRKSTVGEEIMNHSLIIPQYIVDITKHVERKFEALFEHHTQMEGKEYAPLIPALARLRGMQITGDTEEFRWGESFRQIIIPGVTESENMLSYYLEGNMYELEKIDTPIRRTQISKDQVVMQSVASR